MIALDARRAATLLGVVSVGLLAARLYAAGQVGFGDSEALYAAYALHPQPAYVDHPGLVGVVMGTLGAGHAPGAPRVHLATSALATLFPWLLAATAVACGAPRRRALVAALVAALTPEIAIGLFALTPDLLLGFAWVGCVGLAAHGLAGDPRRLDRAAALLAAGLLAGVAAVSKITGLALFAVLPLALLGPGARAHARSPWPWVGLALGALVVLPVAAYERAQGWPMLAHRLVATQAEAGVSLRNLGAVLGGQLVYLSPPTLVLVALAARDAWRGRGDAVGRVLLLGAALPAAALLPLCVWSRVAEPHWLAPAFLTLVLAAARAPSGPAPRLVGITLGVEGILVAAVHAWILVPGLPSKLTPTNTDARLDISHELFGWPEAVRAVRETAAQATSPDARPGDVVVAAPHWVLCAQLEAALEGTLPVGCDTPSGDDFDRWLPRERWQKAEVLVWVSDDRFDGPFFRPSFGRLLDDHVPLRRTKVPIFRGGQVIRTFTLTVLGRSQAG